MSRTADSSDGGCYGRARQQSSQREFLSTEFVSLRLDTPAMFGRQRVAWAHSRTAMRRDVSRMTRLPGLPEILMALRFAAAVATMLFVRDARATQPAERAAAQAPRAAAPRVQPNDLRMPAGRTVNGALRIELDVVSATVVPFLPSPGAAAPVVRPTVAFAERGKAPQFPGPLLRFRAGVPVQMVVRNTLERQVAVRGLGERTPGDTTVQGEPAFLARPPLMLAPGEERVVAFTPGTAVSSFYVASVSRDSTPPPPGQTDLLAGAFVVDASDSAPPSGERVLFISLAEGLTINGRTWPYTERLTYAEGETVHWRVINATNEYHPMHLHGAYFTVNARGDAQTETAITGEKPLLVTEGMLPFSTMQMSWTPHTAGNWLFHCHLVVHSQGPLPDTTAAAVAAAVAHESTHGAAGDMPMRDAMAGLIMGVTVTPKVVAALTPPANARRLDLWTGTRTGVFGDSSALGFVLQRGARPPAPDSIVVPGSPLILTRGEPAHIMVHNRLTVPLSLHWHGMELPSYYDGVGHWSGTPGHVRPPIAPGDSQSVYFTPPRAGSFMYHIHGESSAELQQGLYGALVVVEKGRTMDAAADRVFLLASRGSTPDAPPAINGRALVPAERFDAGRRYRLRFLHISTNDVRTVRLLRDGKPVQWRPLARDGATLPAALQAPLSASMRMDVGQTYDVEWTPESTGVYVLEVATESIIIGRPAPQRVAFGVGPVADSVLRIAATGTALPLADLPKERLAAYRGAYGANDGIASGEYVTLWTGKAGLTMSRTVAGAESASSVLMPLANGTFVRGTSDDGRYQAVMPLVSHRIDAQTLTVGEGSTVRRYTRQARVIVDSMVLARYVGQYADFAIKQAGDRLMIGGLGPNDRPLVPLSPSLFHLDLDGSPFTIAFNSTDGKVVSFTVLEPDFTVPRRK